VLSIVFGNRVGLTPDETPERTSQSDWLSMKHPSEQANLIGFQWNTRANKRIFFSVLHTTEHKSWLFFLLMLLG